MNKHLRRHRITTATVACSSGLPLSCSSARAAKGKLMFPSVLFVLPHACRALLLFLLFLLCGHTSPRCRTVLTPISYRCGARAATQNAGFAHFAVVWSVSLTCHSFRLCVRVRIIVLLRCRSRRRVLQPDRETLLFCCARKPGARMMLMRVCLRCVRVCVCGCVDGGGVVLCSDRTPRAP